MSGLLNSLRSPTKNTGDDHGVAELLEAVSKRSMSCTQEEKQELDNISKRVREHNHKPNPVEMLQKKLSSMQMGSSNHSKDNNNDKQPEPSLADDFNSSGIVSSPAPPPNKPKLNEKLGNFANSTKPKLNKMGQDIKEKFSGLKTQLSQAKMQVEERLHAERRQPRPSQQQQQPAQEYEAAPTIVVLPPLEDPKMVAPTIDKPAQQQEDDADEQNVFVIGDDDDDDEEAVDEKQPSDTAAQGEEKKQDL